MFRENREINRFDRDIVRSPDLILDCWRKFNVAKTSIIYKLDVNVTMYIL